MKAKMSGDDVYQVLKKKLVSFEFKPGQWLPENEIASQLKASRTTIRYALSKLKSDGLLEIIPRKGAFVKSFSINDIVEIFQMREVLEGLAARLAAENIDLEALKEFENFYSNCERNNSTKDLRELFDFGNKFHDFIIRNAGNKRIEQSLNEFRIQLEISRRFILNQKSEIQPSRLPQVIREHLDIIKALKERNGELAESRMKEHISNAASYALSMSHFRKYLQRD